MCLINQYLATILASRGSKFKLKRVSGRDDREKVAGRGDREKVAEKVHRGEREFGHKSFLKM